VRVGDVVEHAISAAESFEVFMGKRYDPAQRGASSSSSSSSSFAGLTSQDILVPSHPAFEAMAKHITERLDAGLGPRRSGALAPPKKLESPLERYTRLVEEVHALRDELRVVEEGDSRRAPGTTAVDHSSGVFKTIAGGTGALAAQLDNMQGPASVSGAGAGSGKGVEADAVARPDASLASLHALAADLASLTQMQANLAAAAEAMRKNLSAMEQQLNKALIGAGAGAGAGSGGPRA
jgi:hypothetical protein